MQWVCTSYAIRDTHHLSIYVDSTTLFKTKTMIGVHKEIQTILVLIRNYGYNISNYLNV